MVPIAMHETRDLVVQYEILKSQTLLEEKACREWPRKWGFYLDFDKLMLDEAARRGISEEEYRRRTEIRKPRGPSEPDILPIKPAQGVPVTSTGMVGWRASKEYSLEKFGPLYISPKHTLPYDLAPSSIFLG
ncbi:ciliary microtubule inner protein 1-like [Euwallacea similis]|uniref:ciliary microtubule inner protein 1-like n=1 Tax=Euwallacea similis TaxID=1736056 RepID=UPI003450260D